MLYLNQKFVNTVITTYMYNGHTKKNEGDDILKIISHL